MLSDEEKKAIEIVKGLAVYYDDYDLLDEEEIEENEEVNNSINIVVNLIAKQSKEIEELKANKGYHLGFIDGGIAKRYEYEDKIKAKIEEIDEAIKVNKECAKDNADRITVRLLNDEINELKKARNVLQSLLEKE